MPIQNIETIEEFNALVEKESVVLVDFSAPWCGPCRFIGPIFEKMSDEYDGVIFAKVSEGEESADLIHHARVSAYPTFHLYKDGKKSEEILGANQEKLIELLGKVATAKPQESAKPDP